MCLAQNENENESGEMISGNFFLFGLLCVTSFLMFRCRGVGRLMRLAIDTKFLIIEGKTAEFYFAGSP